MPADAKAAKKLAAKEEKKALKAGRQERLEKGGQGEGVSWMEQMLEQAKDKEHERRHSEQTPGSTAEKLAADYSFKAVHNPILVGTICLLILGSVGFALLVIVGRSLLR
eukprot:TRINITY_DN52874_c0_g1_i1.p1 TRINITY_DN52874_c0_g1~~TRINITY_DN52874_c0_g1_i1.p1  ORF type:complete len:109 (-),score=24.45 TRINITY_DN52874_c0_g1_i1:304-630(-)